MRKFLKIFLIIPIFFILYFKIKIFIVLHRPNNIIST
jgi:hypothetical protein